MSQPTAEWAGWCMVHTGLLGRPVRTARGYVRTSDGQHLARLGPHDHLTTPDLAPYLPAGQLMSAAPDLLAALRTLMDYAACGTVLAPGSVDWEQARAALAKADGGAMSKRHPVVNIKVSRLTHDHLLFVKGTMCAADLRDPTWDEVVTELLRIWRRQSSAENVWEEQ